MAGGGKETPRQRMIGMMYLVLTALLALQVQSEVLEKFYFIDDSLQEAKGIALSTNEKILKSMDTQIKEGKTSPANKVFLDKAYKVKKVTAEMLGKIQAIRQQIIAEMGDKNENGEYPQAKSYDGINRIMIGIEGGEPGKGYPLKDQLNKYGEDIAAIDEKVKEAIKQHLPMAKEPGESSGGGHGDAAVDWPHKYFGNTPMVATLAVLSQIENDVVKVETDAIKKLQSRFGDFEIKFDKVEAMASAESNTVAAGTKYRAKLFITAGSSSLRPKMRSSVGGVQIKDGVGIVEFTASGGTTEGQKKSWTGSITIKNAGGVDTTLSVKQEYTVVSPIIEVESGTVNSLYLKCGNDLKIKVPALGVDYNPSFSATGGSVLSGKGGKGSVIVVPTSAKVALSVSSGGNKIGTKNFKVKMVPKPTVVPKGLNLKTGGRCPRTVNLQALPDPGFRDALPKDARYRVTGAKVTLARGARALGSINGGSSIKLGGLCGKARAGDRLVIEVSKVMRMNFQNKTEPVSVSVVPMTYPITQ